MSAAERAVGVEQLSVDHDAQPREEPRYAVVALTAIAPDRDLWPRVALNQARVTEFSNLYRDHLACLKAQRPGGAIPPPVLVTRWQDEQGRHLLVDGFHRYEAAVRAGVASFTVRFSEAGDEGAVMDEALTLTAFSALPLRPADRRKAVVDLLEDSDHTQADIARRCGVTRQAVSKIAKRLDAGEERDAIIRGAAGGARRSTITDLRVAAGRVVQALAALQAARGGVLGTGIGRLSDGDVARALVAAARRSDEGRAAERLSASGALINSAADLAGRVKS